ncbi:MAG: hypothetical protein RL417_2584 [Pseudomonadota bacterium]|jgi:hypothetical protein
MSILGGFALTSPFMLLLVPGALAGLVYAYRRYGRGIRRPVGTLLLLKALERAPSARQQFKPPPRFFLELLLLSLLLLGAAGLYRRESGERVLVVIDNSLSMGVLPPGERLSILDRAKSNAQSAVDSLASDSQIAVITTEAPGVGPLSGIDEAYDAIGAIELGYSVDNLERLLARVGGDSRFDRVLAFTDRRAQFLAPESRARIEVNTVAEAPTANIAVSDVSLTTTPAGQQTVRAAITSYYEQAVDIAVVLEAVSVVGTVSVVKRETVAIPPKETRSVQFSPVALKTAAYRVSVVPPLGSSGAVNTLLADDEGWLSAAPPAERITVVSDLSAEALGLNRLRHLRFEVIKPSDWSAERASRAGSAIFHRFTPAEIPNGNTLFVMPPAGGIFEVGDTVAEAEVTRWNVADPLASYLNLPALTFKTVTPLKLPPWAREAIATTGGSVALSGSYEGKRIAALGFEIFPYEGAKSRILSVLTLNALGWIAETGIGFEPVGTTIDISPEITNVRYASGEPLWGKGDKPTSVVTLKHPGLVIVKGALNTEAVRVVNFFDERESNTLIHAPIAIERIALSERDDESERRYLAGSIALLGAILILLDLLLFSRRIGGGRVAQEGA